MSATAGPSVSVVIPAHNEERYLPRLLDSVDVARDRAQAAGCRVEVLVADDASTDGTARVAAERGCVVVSVAVRNIGAARNGGARAATGEVLVFVDADARIHPDTLAEAVRLLARPDVVGGASGVVLERWSPGLVVTWCVMVPLVWLTGFDTGAVFVRRDDFVAIGGYDERRRVAEDVDFLVRLRRHGRAGGRRLVRASRVKAVASTRKFDRFGDWHYLRLLPLAGRLLWDRSHSDAFVERYWYDGTQR